MQSSSTKMITRKGISVSIARDSNGQVYEANQRRSHHRPLYPSTTRTIEVGQGDIFHPRIEIPASFDWHESNILAVRVDYSA